MNKLLKIFLLFTFSVTGLANGLVKIGEVETSTLLSNKDVLKNVGFQCKSKSKIGEFKALDLYSIVSKFVDSEKDSQYMIGAIDAEGVERYYSYAEFTPGSSPLPAQLLLAKPDFAYGDTLRLTDAKGNINEKLDQISCGSHKQIIQLQINNLTGEERKKYFVPFSIIISSDTSTKRWAYGIRKIIIYKIVN